MQVMAATTVVPMLSVLILVVLAEIIRLLGWHRRYFYVPRHRAKGLSTMQAVAQWTHWGPPIYPDQWLEGIT